MKQAECNPTVRLRGTKNKPAFALDRTTLQILKHLRQFKYNKQEINCWLSELQPSIQLVM